MCLSTVFYNSTVKENEIMRDVAQIEAEGRGFWLISLFGEKKFVEGTIKAIDLVEEHYVVLGH